MENKLFVGNLSWGSTEDSLKAFFEQAGEVVEVNIIKDRATDRSKGFAFVVMATAEGKEAAMKLDGQELDGRPIKIAEARPPKNDR